MNAHITNTTKDDHRNPKNLVANHNQFNNTIDLKIKELTDSGISLGQIQIEVQTMLNNSQSDSQTRGHTSMSLRGFYGSGIFSCRGFA